MTGARQGWASLLKLGRGAGCRLQRGASNHEAAGRAVWRGKAWWLVWAWLALMPLAHAETTTYYVTNAQGTVVATMDHQGGVTYTAAYRPYGQQVKGAPQPGPGYTGHVNDPATGLVYMQQRYYDPTTGRFISPDPVAPTPGNIYSFNRYAYANNNPIRNIDPDGREVVFGPNVSQAYIAQYDSAVAYLIKAGVAGPVLAMEKSNIKVHLFSGSPTKSDGAGVIKGTKKLAIVWAAKGGLSTKKGMMTPAISLLHEAAHIMGTINGTKLSTKPDGTKWTSPEEKRVIKTIENPAAKKLGEPVRDNHYGWPMPVDCSTCRRPSFEDPDDGSKIRQIESRLGLI